MCPDPEPQIPADESRSLHRRVRRPDAASFHALIAHDADEAVTGRVGNRQAEASDAGQLPHRQVERGAVTAVYDVEELSGGERTEPATRELDVLAEEAPDEPGISKRALWIAGGIAGAILLAIIAGIIAFAAYGAANAVRPPDAAEQENTTSIRVAGARVADAETRSVEFRLQGDP